MWGLKGLRVDIMTDEHDGFLSHRRWGPRYVYSRGSTTFRGGSPRRSRTTFSSAASIECRRWVGFANATWGVITTFGRSWNGRRNGRPQSPAGCVHHTPT